jgi:pimeloyl-ACP methyl ester carboxylesterase
METDPSKVLSDDWDLDRSDRACSHARTCRGCSMRLCGRLIDPASGAGSMTTLRLSHVAPWGFDAADIRVPVTVRYGEEDVLVPAAHGAWLAAHVAWPS